MRKQSTFTKFRKTQSKQLTLSQFCSLLSQTYEIPGVPSAVEIEGNGEEPGSTVDVQRRLQFLGSIVMLTDELCHDITY